MKLYAGNRFPFCCALFAKADAAEAGAVIETLGAHRIRCAVPKRRLADCVSRAAVVLLFLSPEAIHDKAVLKGVSKACILGKPVLTVFLQETRLTPGLSMQLGQMQAILKYSEESDEAFYRKLLNAPALQTMSVTPQQQKVLRRHTQLWAVGGAVVLAAAILIGVYWRPLKAMLPTSPLQRVGVPLDFESVETLYVYGETPVDAYGMPKYRLYTDGERDWAMLEGRLIPPGDIAKLDDFAMLPNIQELCICNDRIESIRPLLSLTQLTLLDLSHNRLFSLRGIDALSALETLNLSHNPIQELDDLVGLPKLRTLNVACTDAASLEPLLSMPSLQTLYIDAKLLDAAKVLEETSIEIVCLDTPVYRYAELAEALKDPQVTDICIMKTVTVPRGQEILIRPEVTLTQRNADLSISVYGTVRLEGVWKMTSKQYNYGTILIENGGVCVSKETATLHLGAIEVQQGGRHYLQDGASFTFHGGSYVNRGDVYLRNGFHVQYVSGRASNYGALHLRTADLRNIGSDIPLDQIYNGGLVYLDGFVILDGRKQKANDMK